MVQYPCQNPMACFLLMQFPCQSPTRPADVVMLIWVPCNYHANRNWHTSCYMQLPCQQNMAYKMQVQEPCQRDTQRTKPNDRCNFRAKVCLFSSGILNAKCKYRANPESLLSHAISMPFYQHHTIPSLGIILAGQLASLIHHAISIPYSMSKAYTLPILFTPAV